MGIVYLALAQGPGGFSKLKVVKRLRPDLAGEPGAVQMFLEEGRLSARLHHPNIVQMNEVGFDGKHYFLEMEYLEGQSLTALTKRAARGEGLALPLAVYVLAQTLAGLHYAHELADHDGTPLAVVHRDVSPHNILVTYDGRVKVLDFGIAKAAGSSAETKTGFLKGKVTYMAPEQVARKALDRRVDLFAVGVMLWEALTSERMWGDLDDFEIFLKLRSDALRSPRAVKADVPDELDAVCMKALAREPEGRFATAAEMQAALEAWLERDGGRAGARELAARMGDLFAEDRAATKAEIDSQIKATPVNESLVGVPMLRVANLSALTGSGLGTTSKTITGQTRVRQAREIRGLRSLVLASLGIAMVASVAAGVAVVRGKKGKGAAAKASAAAVAAGGCAKSAECNEGDGGKAPRVCRKGKCVALATDRCEVLAEPGDANDDRTFWIGAMFPTSGADGESFGRAYVNALELMRRDFVSTTRGIPSQDPRGPSRPIGIVACDDSHDERPSALHLTEDVEAQAVVGFRTSQEAIDLARDVFVPHGTFVAVAVGQSAQVTLVPQPREGPRLVWRTTPVGTLRAIPAAHLVSDLIEPRLRKAGIVSDMNPMRVAVILPKSQYGLSIGEALRKVLAFNGRPAIANGEAFAQLTFDFQDPTRPNPDFASIVRELIERAPNVVLYAGEDELVSTVFVPVERGWKAKERPDWISLTNLGGPELFTLLRSDSSLRQRIFGVSTPEATPANAQLALHYSSEFSRMTVSDTPAASYDAAYAIAYSAYAAGDGPLSGAGLAAALARLLPPGVPIEVGPTHIFEGIESLRAGHNIDLVGANTTLDFDPATGETSTDWLIQRAGLDRRRGTVSATESGVFFDARTKTLQGSLH